MKTLLSILFCLCMVGCVTPTPVEPPSPPEPPKPPVVVVPTGPYLITKFDSNGVPLKTWEVEAYDERSFPRRVTFEHDGQTITLDGSFQIDRKLK